MCLSVSVIALHVLQVLPVQMSLPAGREVSALLLTAGGVLLASVGLLAAVRSGRFPPKSSSTPAPAGAAASAKKPTRVQLVAFLKAIATGLDSAPGLIRAIDAEEKATAARMQAQQRAPPPPRPLTSKWETVVGNVTQQTLKATGFSEPLFAAAFAEALAAGDAEVRAAGDAVLAKHPLHGITAGMVLEGVHATLRSELSNFVACAKAVKEEVASGKLTPRPLDGRMTITKAMAAITETDMPRVQLLNEISLRMFDVEGASEDGAKAVLAKLGGVWTAARIALWPHIVQHYYGTDADFVTRMTSASAGFRRGMWLAGLLELADDHHRGLDEGPASHGGRSGADDGLDGDDGDFDGDDGPMGMGGGGMSLADLPPELLSQLPPGVDINQLMAAMAAMGGGGRR